MLVLSRKVDESIVIDDEIRITVTKISGNRVTLGIQAPPHVRVLRGELHEFEVVAVPHQSGAHAERSKVRVTV